MSEKQERKGFYSREEVAAILKDFQEKNYQAMARSTGNGAKMRDALLAFVRAYEIDDELANIEETSIAYHKALEALATPPRNCDVGTADEQYARWRRFCDSQKCCNNQCPVYKLADVCGSKAACNLIWAQMPHEEGGEK